jgi:DNA repair ATPase RecN
MKAAIARYRIVAEMVRERLDLVEQALLETAAALENEKKGLLRVMESTRSSVNLCLEDIDSVITNWNMLARKHGVSPFSLPACHESLQCKLLGDDEARSQLRIAEEKESENSKPCLAYAQSCHRHEAKLPTLYQRL